MEYISIGPYKNEKTADILADLSYRIATRDRNKYKTEVDAMILELKLRQVDWTHYLAEYRNYFA